jgi:hypothetical protein
MIENRELAAQVAKLQAQQSASSSTQQDDEELDFSFGGKNNQEVHDLK